MKSQSNNNTTSYLLQVRNYMIKFDNINTSIINNIRDVINNNGVEIDYKNKKAPIMNKLYNLFFIKFIEIHDECVKNYIKREDSFIGLISSLEISIRTVLKDIKQNKDELGINRKKMKKNIIRILDKIKNYKKGLVVEKNNLLFRLSCKLGNDLTRNISDYL